MQFCAQNNQIIQISTHRCTVVHLLNCYVSTRILVAFMKHVSKKASMLLGGASLCMCEYICIKYQNMGLGFVGVRDSKNYWCIR